MKIGFIAWDRFGYGGVSRILSSLFTELSKDYEIDVLCLKNKEFFQNVYAIDTNIVKFSFTELTFTQKIRREIANKIIHRINFSNNRYLVKIFPRIKYSRSYLNKIANWINNHNFDIVVFGSGFEDCLQLAAIKNKIRENIKLVGWSHASFKDYFRDEKSTYCANIKSIWKKHYKVFDKIIVLSDADVNECKRQLNLDSIRIYNSNSFIPTKISRLKSKRFLYVGALSYNKGSEILIKAFGEFAKNNSEWGLDIYGEGPDREYIQQFISEYKLFDRVRIYNFVSDVESVYADHDILLFPSRYEGFGIVQIEAASCGLPVIAADLPITRELMSKYQYGEIFEWNDPLSLSKRMLELVNSDLSEYSVQGIRASEDFRIDQIAKQWKDLFSLLISTK